MHSDHADRVSCRAIKFDDVFKVGPLFPSRDAVFQESRGLIHMRMRDPRHIFRDVRFRCVMIEQRLCILEHRLAQCQTVGGDTGRRIK